MKIKKIHWMLFILCCSFLLWLWIGSGMFFSSVNSQSFTDCSKVHIDKVYKRVDARTYYRFRDKYTEKWVTDWLLVD